MTRRVWLPPDVIDDLGTHGDRIDRLERKTPQSSLAPEPAFVEFSYPGVLTAGARSSPYQHPTGGRLVRARCQLGTAGGSSTVLAFYRNGVELAPVQTSGGEVDEEGTIEESSYYNLDGEARIPEGQTLGVVFFVGRRFAPDVHSLEVEVVTAGTGASRLTVRTDWVA